MTILLFFILAILAVVSARHTYKSFKKLNEEDKIGDLVFFGVKMEVLTAVVIAIIFVCTGFYLLFEMLFNF